MSEHRGQMATATTATRERVHLAAPEGFVSWQEYWKAQGTPWRTEPEIDVERQRELSARRAAPVDLARGSYPFAGVRLDRADAEWLLATHESGGMRGPVDWTDERQRGRTGLDLRGADLRGQDLRALPLARMIGGWLLDEVPEATSEQIERAAVHLEGATFRGGFERQAHLEGARLTGAHLEGASMYRAHLERAGLDRAHLQGSDLGRANLQGASLAGSHLEGALLSQAHLESVILSGSILGGTARHPPADLRGAFLDSATTLDDAVLADPQYGAIRVAGTHWGEVDLSVVTWDRIEQLGDEGVARSKVDKQGRRKAGATRLAEYTAAARANRVLSVALQAQGLSDDAARFAYRAQVLQRRVLYRQRKVGGYLFSVLLATLAGYGYRLWRILVTYALALLVFAGAYFAAGLWWGGSHLAWYEALLVSLTAIHGRVFFTSFGLDGVQSWIAAVESVVGIVIEGVFVAMLIQRFFAR